MFSLFMKGHTVAMTYFYIHINKNSKLPGSKYNSTLGTTNPGGIHRWVDWPSMDGGGGGGEEEMMKPLLY
jgi:hypothetical protein